MKFKKLEVFGFKSFADKLEVKFSDGVTAIVGPNGCGKSNVADSIRWVLGEQSAKLLRGSSMQDVIFNGTEKRKSLSFCEVSLFFDNKDKQLFANLDYDEVVISRKLYRSGESEYYINKSQCRLKDITDLLRDGGMGREGYSIIGQGRIDELLSAKPEDRRAIFEEAAGISKFKARKVDAERKLGRTRDNITRINDILAEKSRILDPLTKQAEAARKWLDLRDKLKFYEINTYIHQFESASNAKEIINNRLRGVEEEIAMREKECDEATTQYNEAAGKLANVDREIDSLREELLNLTVGMEKQAGHVKLLNERLNYLNQQNDKLKNENSALNKQYLETIDLAEQGEREKETRLTELGALKIDVEKINNQYLSVVEELTAGEGEVEANHRAVLEAMDKLTEIRSNMSRLLTEKENLAASVQELAARLEIARQNVAAVREEESALAEEVRAMGADRAAMSADMDKLYEKNNENVAVLNRLNAKLEGLNADFYMVKSRAKMLKEIREAYDGYAAGVRNLLNEAKGNAQVSARIEGVVADLIQVDSKFEVAIEMALGAALQNIVTKTEEDAKALIEFLKIKRLGRVTFLPMSSIKPRSLDREHAGKSFEGCYGVACDLIGYDKKYDTVMRGLLGNTVIAENIDTAIRVARKTGFSFKIVTLDGDVVNPHGSITGGSRKADSTNLISRDRELAEANEQFAKIEAEIKAATAERDERTAEQAELQQLLKGEREKLHTLEVEYATKSESLSGLRSRLESLSTQAAEIETEATAKSQRITEIETDIGSVGELENLIRTKKQNATDSGQERQQQFDALRKERDRLHEALTDGRLKAAQTEAELNALENDIGRLKSNSQTLAERIAENSEQIVVNDETIADVNAELNGLTDGVVGADDTRVRQLRAQLGDLDSYKQKLTDNRADSDAKRIDLMNLLQQLHENANKERMQLLKVDTDIEQMQQRVEEEYHLEYNDCLPFKEEGYDLERGIAETNRIRRQMNNLGHVNVDAIEQCKEIYNSYHEMDVQREDLVKAEADLVKIIAELSVEMLDRFTEKFAQIRSNFTRIFTELFDGGTADLVLLESENPLEAGIDIVAQPPQKKLQSISLLSGGERALTAIAILFAILRLKPMPFCVLDEIEAALDDANAGRFAKYLRRFSEETQFIVITHRKPTMELADNLYGVTMEEKGVSKIVSVKLSEAVAQAEPA